MIKPFVSVLIPAFNAEKTIERSINSVLNQTYTNYEILVVDDFSLDQTINVLNKYLDVIILIKHKKNFGEATTRNTLMQHANGEYFAWLDSDDEWDNNKLNMQIDFMTKKKINVSVTSFALINKNLYQNSKIIFNQYQKFDYKYALTKGSHSTALFSTLIIAKKLSLKIGNIPTNYILYVDWHYLINIVKFCSIDVHNSPLSNIYYNFSKGSMALFSSSRLLIHHNKNFISNLSLFIKFKFYSLIYRDIASVYFDDKRIIRSSIFYIISFFLSPRFPSLIFFKRLKNYLLLNK
ncbi:glycosyltransferase family 2 protein [Alphaproteobacteria bacterium]|nr:glycosyltransferase family 2 protein [Alphaproteobacteria bacterium]